MFDKFMKKKRLDDYKSSLCWRKKLLVMRLVYFLMVGFVALAPISVSAQDKMISLEIRSETLSSVLMKIKDRTGVNILYNENALRDVPCKDMKLENVTVEEALNVASLKERFTYEVSRGVIVVRERQAKEVQRELVRVSGQVSDEKGERLPGVTVLIKELLPVPRQILTGNSPFQSRRGNMYYSFQWLEWNLKKLFLTVTRRFQELL